MASSSGKAPELLAPAGGREAFVAAIANGADAVYLGVDRLNARRGAENFTLETLGEICRFAHLRAVRVYLTVNVVVLQAEMSEALELVDRAWTSGVDAVIVQDLGLLNVARETLPHVRIHSSTQLNAHNTPTIRALSSLGISRVTLAREVSIAEIASLVSGSPIEIESFVHGALCVCYSGQCLMSSLIGGRSANRGHCAQPCRMTYELVDGTGTVLAAAGAHLLSPKDLAGIGVLPALARAGVAALKIEGRMKNPEYVALVTGVYRSALDRAVEGAGGYEVRDGEMAVLSESFSRGFTEAYLLGQRGNDMMSYKRPNNRGVLAGRVVSTSGNTATVALDGALEADDTIEFWTSAGRFAQPVGVLSFDGGQHNSAPAGIRAAIAVEHSVSAGDRVFRVRNAALSAAARRTFDHAAEVAPVDLDFRVRVVVGKPLYVEVRDRAGRRGAFEGAVIEAARTKALTAEEISEHVGRLGGTHYRIGALDVELSPNAGAGFSALHGARREALQDFEDAILEPWSGRRLVIPRLPALSDSSPQIVVPDIVVECVDLAVAMASLEAGADRVHVPTYVLGPHVVPDRVVPLISRILHDREVAAAARFAADGRPIAVANLGMIGEAASAGARVEAHWSLNAVNPQSVMQLKLLGAGFVWLSPELSGRQVAEVCAAVDVGAGVAVWGRQEVMATEHCILMAEGECDGACALCDRRRSVRRLRDRKGYEFPVLTDVTGRSHLFNSVRLDLTEALPEVLACGVAAIRLDVHTESASDAADAVAAMRTARDAAAAGRPVGVRPGRDKTSGHFFRGLG